MGKLAIKKGSVVKVITGSDKGTTGAVLEVDSKNMKVKVEGVKVQTHYDDKAAGLKKKEGFIDYSNVKLVEAAKKAAKKTTKAKSKNA